MNILDILYGLTIEPIELIIEFIITQLTVCTQNFGLSIILLSVILNILLLPIYNRAEAIQKENSIKQLAMKPYVSHIKKTFHGIEQTMMLQTYYKINKYKPIYALKNSISLFIQIPFFIAAYDLISFLTTTLNTPFGPIDNIGQPDGMISIGNITINVLPIIMTVINIISSLIYTKKSTITEKIQLIGIAIIFLIILYNSPSGVVLYWIMNNLFSLIKNIVYSIHPPKKHTNDSNEKQHASFAVASICLIVLTGLFIPAAVIESSPSEFIIQQNYVSPVLYILKSFILATGLFGLWMTILYKLTPPKKQIIIEMFAHVIAIGSLINYMFFETASGALTPSLKYEKHMEISPLSYMLNCATIIVIVLITTILIIKFKKILIKASLVVTIALSCIFIINLIKINIETKEIKQKIDENPITEPKLTLSKNGKNVIVFMLDRAIDGYIPYIFNELPELAKQFEGFTWYPNTLSYSMRTNLAAPALFGGYEYTPVEINARESEPLAKKNDEALKLMPTLFSQENYNIMIGDPPYAGYTLFPTLSIFDDIDNATAFTIGEGESIDQNERLENFQKIWNRNLFCYSLMRCTPLMFRPTMYQDGMYFGIKATDSIQIQYSKSVAYGRHLGFENSYYALKRYKGLTEITDDESNNFLMLQNSTTHECVILSEPDYTYNINVDNTEYDETHTDRFTVNGQTLNINTAESMESYHTNIASLKELGLWFDYMRENNVFDNTRIIIVADHGWPVGALESLKLMEKPEKDEFNIADIMAYNPLLLVKDFNSQEFTIDDSFMTNADVPLLATKDIITEPINPFTNKPLTDSEKYKDKHVFYSNTWNVKELDGNTFGEGWWLTLKGLSIFDKTAWSSDYIRNGD